MLSGKTLVRQVVGRLGVASRATVLSDAVFYGGRPTLRIAVFHSVGGVAFDRFRRFVDLMRADVPLVTADDVEQVDTGRRRVERKELAITFDDGFRNNFKAASWLAEERIRSIFFVIPALLGRTGDAYLAWHAARGVNAFLTRDRYEETVGLDPSQLLEMREMGHTIGLHPDAHRCLAQLTAAELRYEVVDAKQRLEALLGAQVRHFAYSFGHVKHASPVSERIVRTAFDHVHFACRGGNRQDSGPNCLLRDNVDLDHPPQFARFAVLGGIDALYAAERREIEALVGRR